MAKEKPVYEVVGEFSTFASDIVTKYPTIFEGIDVQKVRCVKITNNPRPEKKSQRWELQAVKMPVLMDAPYGWYVTVYSSDWDKFDERQKLLLVAEILHGIPQTEGEEGKVVPCDTKGYGTMYRTFGGIDYLDDPKSPDILKEDVSWIVERE